MVIKTLESALADLKDEKGEKVTRVRESLTALLAFSRKVVEAAKKEEESEAEESEAEEAEAAEEPAPKAKDGADADGDKDAEEAEAAKDLYVKGSAMVAKAKAMGHKPPKQESEAEGMESEAEESESESEAKEAAVLAVKGLLREAKLDEELVDVKALAKLPLKKAKESIAETKRIAAALNRKLVRTLESGGAGHRAKAPVASPSDNTAAFADVTK